MTLCFCGLFSPSLLPFFIPLIVLLFASSLPSSVSFPFPPTALPLLYLLLQFSLLPLLPPCSVRDKFVEVDLKPVCKHCYERLPDDMKRRLAKRERDSKEKKKKILIPMCLWSSLSHLSTLPLFFLWSVSIILPVCSLIFPVSSSSYFRHVSIPHTIIIIILSHVDDESRDLIKHIWVT